MKYYILLSINPNFRNAATLILDNIKLMLFLMEVHTIFKL